MQLLFPILIVFFLLMIFLNFRKQRQTVAKTTQLQDSLKPGDEVLTTAGLYATVVAVVGDTVDLEISNGVITTWSRAVVREVLVDSDDDSDDDSVDSIDSAKDAYVVDEFGLGGDTVAPATENSTDKAGLGDEPTDPSSPRLTKD